MKLRLLSILAFAVILSSIGCESKAPVSESENPPIEAGVVELTARGLILSGPDTTLSGWTTFRLTNESEMVHFAVLERLPEGIGAKEQQEDIAPVFQRGMDLLNKGELDSALAEFGNLPPYFGEIVFFGGPGFISPGGTAETTVYVEPGKYLLECYVKTNGVFHSYNPVRDVYGMVHEFVAREESSTATRPEPTIEITLSGANGIEVNDTVAAGPHTVAVTFLDQTTHEHFLGHDVHLVRLTEETDMDALVTWMDWTQPTGLETPAPAQFLGGVHEMPVGETGFFNVTLEPGEYAWISEVPSPDEKGMLKRFTVSGDLAASD